MRRYLDAIWPRGVVLASEAARRAAEQAVLALQAGTPSEPNEAMQGAKEGSGKGPLPARPPAAPSTTAVPLTAAPLPEIAARMQGGQLGEAVPKVPSGAKNAAATTGAPAAPGTSGTAGTSGAPIPTRATDTTVDSNFARRLASKNMQVAFANLGNAFQRMMLEPKSQQRFVAELNDLLVQSHTLGSQMAAASALLSPPPIEPARLGGLERALSDVRDNLLQAERAGTASTTVDLRELTRALDSMVVAVEKEGTASTDTIQDLKLLAYQSKQMIAASRFIRKDLASIRLPA